MSAGAATPVAVAPARGRESAHGAVVRSVRAGARWRDIEWIDFASGPEDGGGVAPDEPPRTVPAPDEPAPVAPVPGVEPVRAAPTDLAKALRHFAKPMAEAPIAKGDPIPGLVSRFARMPVPRLPAPPDPNPREPAPHSPPPPPAIASLARLARNESLIFASGVPDIIEPALPATPPEGTDKRAEGVGGAAVDASLLEPPAAAPELTPEPIPELAIEPAAPAPYTRMRRLVRADDDRPFPASIFIPTSTGTSLPEPAPPLRATLAAKVDRVKVVLRDKSGFAILTLSDGVGHIKTALRNRVSRPRAEPKLRPAATDERPNRVDLPPPSLGRLSTQARRAPAFTRLSGYLAGAENRLRLTGIAVLTAMAVAAIAYGGGALLAALAGASGDSSRYAAADKPIQTVQAPVLVRPPAPRPVVRPSEPAARAALYLARARGGDAAAQYDVGVLYARGNGLVQDYASAASWFHAAAAQGDVPAEYDLGVLYERGLGVPKSDTEALNWYRSAADQNHAAAQFNLALAYAEGRGAKQDFAAAAQWYQRAARQGLVPAMVNLAILYERGDGVDRSLVDSYAWYSVAGERGDGDAKNRAGELIEQFNDKDKARAQGLAASIGAALDAAAPPA